MGKARILWVALYFVCLPLIQSMPHGGMLRNIFSMGPPQDTSRFNRQAAYPNQQNNYPFYPNGGNYPIRRGPPQFVQSNFRRPPGRQYNIGGNTFEIVEVELPDYNVNRPRNNFQPGPGQQVIHQNGATYIIENAPPKQGNPPPVPHSRNPNEETIFVIETPSRDGRYPNQQQNAGFIIVPEEPHGNNEINMFTTTTERPKKGFATRHPGVTDIVLNNQAPGGEKPSIVNSNHVYNNVKNTTNRPKFGEDASGKDHWDAFTSKTTTTRKPTTSTESNEDSDYDFGPGIPGIDGKDDVNPEYVKRDTDKKDSDAIVFE